MDQPPKSVLIVDDDPAIRTLIVSVLLRAKIPIDQAANGREAIQRIEQTRYAAIVLDLMMPIASGFDVIDYLQERQPDERCVIVISAAAPAVLREVQEKSVVCAVLRKPFDISELVTAVRGCLV